MRKQWTPLSHYRQIYHQRLRPRIPFLRPLPNPSRNSFKQPLRKHNELPKRNTKRNLPPFPSDINKRRKQSGQNYSKVPSRFAKISSHKHNRQCNCSYNKQRNFKGSGNNETVNVLKRKRSDKRNSCNNRKQHEWPRNQRLGLPRLRLHTNKQKRRLSYKLSFCISRSLSWKQPARRDWTHPAQQPHQQPTRPPPSHLHQIHLRPSNGTHHHLCSPPNGSNIRYTSELGH